MRADIRPNFIANDIVLTSLAARPVETLEDLKHVRGLSGGAVDRHGRGILAAIRAGLSCPAEQRPVPPDRLRRKAPPPGLTALLRAAVQAVAEREDMASEVIASGRDIDALGSYAMGPSDGGVPAEVSVAHGWRRALVGDTLLAIARGELAIRYDPRRREVVGDPVRADPDRRSELGSDLGSDSGSDSS
jgi:ribonuclease D